MNPPSGDEWPSPTTLDAFTVVASHNLATDAELDSLRAERERLIQQCKAAGVDTTPTAVLALHPSAMVLPTILAPAPCVSCATLKQELRAAQDARAVIEHKYQVAHDRYLKMLPVQEQYRQTISRLRLAVATRDARLEKAGVPRTGSVYVRLRKEPS